MGGSWNNSDGDGLRTQSVEVEVGVGVGMGMWKEMVGIIWRERIQSIIMRLDEINGTYWSLMVRDFSRYLTLELAAN